MWPIDTPFQRAGALAVLALASIILDLGIAGIMVHFYTVTFGFAYADALIGSLGMIMVLYHWAHSLALYAMLIAYQFNQPMFNNGKDLAANIGGMLVTGILMGTVYFVCFGLDRRSSKGYQSVQDMLHDN